MFPLQTKSFPATASELAQLMNESIRLVFSVGEDPVSIEAATYPELRRIDINLDGAELRPNPPRPPVAQGERTAALQARELHLSAKDLTLGPATADLRLTAHDVHFDQATDPDDEIVLVLQSAAEGEIEVSSSKAALEKALGDVAKREAAKQGVTIEEVTLVISNRGPRSLVGEVQLKARKLFFSTVVRIGACLDLDDQLNATLTGLACKGEGAIGTLACGVLSPHLQKLDGRTFPLMALPLGEIRLCDVRLSTGDRITVNAEFGA